MKKILQILPILLLYGCTEPKTDDSIVNLSYKKIRFDERDYTDSVVKNYIVLRHDVKVYEILSSEEKRELKSPIELEKEYTIEIVPIDPLDTLVELSFPDNKVELKNFASNKYSFIVSKQIEQDSMLGLCFKLFRINGKYIIENVVSDTQMSVDTVKGLGGFEYYKISK